MQILHLSNTQIPFVRPRFPEHIDTLSVVYFTEKHGESHASDASIMITNPYHGKFSGNPVHLSTHQVFVIEGQRGMSILCLQGQVWVTRAGDIRDYIMPRGMRFVATGSGSIVVNGMADRSTIAVDYAASRIPGPWNLGALQVDTLCVSQIESDARHARAVYFATAFATLFATLIQFLRRSWPRRRIKCVGTAPESAPQESRRGS